MGIIFSKRCPSMVTIYAASCQTMCRQRLKPSVASDKGTGGQRNSMPTREKASSASAPLQMAANTAVAAARQPRCSMTMHSGSGSTAATVPSSMRTAYQPGSSDKVGQHASWSYTVFCGRVTSDTASLRRRQCCWPCSRSQPFQAATWA